MTPPYCDNVSVPPSSALLLLNALSVLHITLAAVLPHSHVFTRSAPIQFPFLIFLTGFMLCRNSESHLSLTPYIPQRFYLRRFTKLFPIHAAVVFLHALVFSTSVHPLRRALFTVLFLSPFLPSSLAFPPEDAPLFVQNFIPAVALCYLIFPVALQVFPRPNTSNRSHLLWALVSTYFLTVVQAHWFTTVPRQINPRPIFLTDIVVAIPFLTHIPAFLFGVASALAYRAFSKPHYTRSRAVLVARFGVATTAVIASLLVSSRHLPEYFHEPSFFSAWTVTGLLLPLLALAAMSAADLSTVTFSTLSTSVNDYVLAHGTTIGLTFYSIAPFIYRMLGSMVCVRSSHSSRAHSCVLSYVHLDSDTVLSDASFRAFSVVPILLIKVPILLFLSTCIVATIALYVTSVAPMTAQLLHSVDEFIASNRYEPQFQTTLMEPSETRYLSTSPLDSQRDWHLFHNRPRMIVAFRIFSCVSALIAFLAAAVIVSIPFNVPMNGLTHNVFRRVLNTLRWLVGAPLLPMIANLIGHALFSKLAWRKPSGPAKSLTLTQTDAAHERKYVGDSSKTTVERHTGAESSMNSHCVDSNNTISDANGAKADDVVHFRLYIRYVTRGQNRRLILRNARRAARILFEECGLPYWLWRVEVVTDRPVRFDEVDRANGIIELVVPEQFSCASRAQYKARALNYAIEASSARSRDWIVHLDEETQFNAVCIHAILNHCNRESVKTFVSCCQQWPKIGQGLIVYGNWLVEDREEEGSGREVGNWITTLADCGRVADDCGRYRLQFKHGDAYIGMHGSFVVVCNNVEKEVTFDHGLEGSIAEDAFFAMVARTKGVRFAWVDATMEERSPLCLLDFMKQRARWLVGGMLVVKSMKLPLWTRWVMGILVSIWFASPVTYTLGIVAIFCSGGSRWDRGFSILVSCLTVMSLWNYVLGFCVSFSVSKLGLIRFLVLLYLQVFLIPVFGFMEMVSVCYALWNFKKVATGFHVIQKDVDSNASDVVNRYLSSEKTPLLPIV